MRHALSLSDVHSELRKVRRLVIQGFCDSYLLMTNARVTGNADARIIAQLKNVGVKHPLILDGGWINQSIASSPELRMYVPRVYGLGDLSLILDERGYDQARALLGYLGEDLATFVVTDAYRRAAKAVAEHGFVLLLGEPAAGKSVIAATLAVTALDHWRCLTTKPDNADELVNAWNPNEPNQFFWLDDAFGSVRHDRALTEGWVRKLPKLMAAIERGAKVVITSRDYIYREAKPFLKAYAYPRLEEQQVVVDVEALTHAERQQILYNHLRLGDQSTAFRSGVKPHLRAATHASTFRPEVARRLGHNAFTRSLLLTRQGVIDFFERPTRFMLDVLQELSPAQRAALALIYLAGGSLVPCVVN